MLRLRSLLLNSPSFDVILRSACQCCFKIKKFSVLEQIVLVYQTLSECQVVARSTGSARIRTNLADRICQCWRAARPGRRGYIICCVSLIRVLIHCSRLISNNKDLLTYLVTFSCVFDNVFVVHAQKWRWFNFWSQTWFDIGDLTTFRATFGRIFIAHAQKFGRSKFGHYRLHWRFLFPEREEYL